MRSNIFKYLLNQMEQNHSFEIKTEILKSLCQMKQPSLSSDFLQLLRTNVEQILPILVKNARVIPQDLENRGEILTEMCLYWLAYMEHQHSGTFYLFLIIINYILTQLRPRAQEFLMAQT